MCKWYKNFALKMLADFLNILFKKNVINYEEKLSITGITKYISILTYHNSVITHAYKTKFS